MRVFANFLLICEATTPGHFLKLNEVPEKACHGLSAFSYIGDKEGAA
jgi:hypothetical protein